VTQDREQVILRLIEDARKFRFCGPSDDPDEITAVTSGYRYLLVQLKRLAGPILPTPAASRLEAIDVEVNNIYSAFEARAEVDALLPDIEDALAVLGGVGKSAGANLWIVDPALIGILKGMTPGRVDVDTLVRICEEINSSLAHGNVLAAALLMRTVLNHVPPVFGCKTFEQVVANSGKSLKESFTHLETGLRKIADFHAHRTMTDAEFYPSTAQVEPFKPQFEVLLQQVAAVITKGRGENRRQ
jgi:hypothetical protein